MDIPQSSIAEPAHPATQNKHPSRPPSPDSPNTTISLPPGTLPPPLHSLLASIRSTLTTTFSSAPPHTAQRLAELLLHPHRHYRTLPSYLRAFDRIVSVASPASIFPLPSINHDLDTHSNTSVNGSGVILNGISSPIRDPADEEGFIGGAELTEIPWLKDPETGILTDKGRENERNTATHAGQGEGKSDLRTESTTLVEGPNGVGGVETVTVALNGNGGISTAVPNAGSEHHGITQGELLRQEQEAGIVPVPSPTHSPSGGRVTRSSAAASAAAHRGVGVVGPEAAPAEEDSTQSALPAEEERVHARGPDKIGMEDMGPQAPGSALAGGLDVEGALGRRGEMETMVGSESTGATQAVQDMELGENEAGEDLTLLDEKGHGQVSTTSTAAKNAEHPVSVEAEEAAKKEGNEADPKETVPNAV